MRSADLTLLHPTFAQRVADLSNRLAAEDIPLLIYEAARSPMRQVDLYARGRSIPGTRKVTRARAWESFHQYTLAVDMVFNLNGKWTWEEPAAGLWKRYQVIARECGLSVLDFERPHVQLPWKLDDLLAGRLPPGKQGPWLSWLSQQQEAWGREPKLVGGIKHPCAPPFDHDIADRPALV